MSPSRRLPDADPYLPGHGSTAFTVSRYELDLDYRVATNRLAGTARLHTRVCAASSRLDLDLAAPLRVSKVRVNGRTARFTHRGGRLAVSLESPAPVGSALIVEVGYSGSPRPSRGPWGAVGWEELDDGVIVAGQPDGAPTWFPCNDHPRHKASFAVTVTTEPDYEVIANGRCVRHERRGSRVRWVFDQPEPTPTYLATLQIGRYVRLDLRGSVKQRAFVPSDLKSRFKHDFGRQPRMMELFESLFGPYPFAGYTVVVTHDRLEIPLEAQGMSVFGSNHVGGRRADERLVAHELSHQWFGNSVTALGWQHIWLHEGFACYAEWLWAEHAGDDSADGLARRHWARLLWLEQDLVIADPGPDAMFDDRLYKRGALTLHALRLTVGDDRFFAMLRDWTTGHRHASVTTRDFIDTVHRHDRGVPESFWRDWLYSSALPKLPDPG